MKETRHLFIYLFRVNKQNYLYVLILFLLFLLCLFLNEQNLLSNASFITIYITIFMVQFFLLCKNEHLIKGLDLEKKGYKNSSFLYFMTNVENTNSILFADLLSLVLDTIILSLMVSFILKQYTIIFFLVGVLYAFLLKLGSTLNIARRRANYLKKSIFDKVELLLCVCFFLFIYLLETSRFNFFHFLRDNTLLISFIITIPIMILMFIAVINRLKEDKTPKRFFLFGNYNYDIIALVLTVCFLSFLADPFYVFHRQTDYVHYLMDKNEIKKLDDYLMKNPKFVNRLDPWGNTPIIKYLSNSMNYRGEIFDVLLKYHPRLDYVRKDDLNSPIKLAVQNCDINSLKKLMAIGANVNAINKDGENALFSMHERKCYEVFPLLRKNNIFIGQRNNMKLSFIEYGKKYYPHFRKNYIQLNQIYHFDENLLTASL